MLLIRPHATLLRIEAEHRGLDIGSDDEVLPNQRLDMARVRDCVCLCVPRGCLLRVVPECPTIACVNECRACSTTSHCQTLTSSPATRIRLAPFMSTSMTQRHASTRIADVGVTYGWTQLGIR